MGSLFSSVGTSVVEGAAGSAVGSATRTTSRGQRGSKLLAIPTSTFQIVTLTFFSLLLGILFYYIFKRQTDFGIDASSKIMISVVLLVVAFVITQSFKLNVMDFIISSEINILCMYLMLCYIGFTYAAYSDPIGTLFTFTGNLFSILVDPTTIYSSGFSLIMPIILFVIPILVLLYDATKSLLNAFITLGISVVIVYFLYPTNNIVPITGGSPPSIFSSNVTCVSSYIGYLNPFNIGKSHC